MAVVKPLPTWVLWAPSLGGRALWSLTAVGLILAVFTVVLLVTRPAHGDAAPTGAGKIIQGASGALHSWGKREA